MFQIQDALVHGECFIPTANWSPQLTPMPRQIYIDFPSINGTPVIVTSTTGPIPQAGNAIPQLFLTFRGASHLIP